MRRHEVVDEETVPQHNDSGAVLRTCRGQFSLWNPGPEHHCSESSCRHAGARSASLVQLCRNPGLGHGACNTPAMGLRLLPQLCFEKRPWQRSANGFERPLGCAGCSLKGSLQQDQHVGRPMRAESWLDIGTDFSAFST